MKKANHFNMLRSILMIFIVQTTLMYGIVTYVSELSQNLVDMNKNSWTVWDRKTDRQTLKLKYCLRLIGECSKVPNTHSRLKK